MKLHADDAVVTDHRRLGWAELRGPAAIEAVTRAGFETSPTLRFDLAEILKRDDARVVLRGAFRNDEVGGFGPTEMPAGYVSVIRDGLVASHDIYEYDDVDAMLGRYVELGGSLAELSDELGAPTGPHPPPPNP